MVCAIPGRPLRRRRRLLLPVDDPDRDEGDGDHDDALAEYASVASFGELALRLIAVGAPPRLVEACHRAALDEIRHADVLESLAGRRGTNFGGIPHLLGRRIGGRARSRRAELRRIAVDSFVDGWLNEGQAARQLRQRAQQMTSPQHAQMLMAMANDEQGHAELARDIVTWCFEEEPVAVGRALASVAPS